MKKIFLFVCFTGICSFGFSQSRTTTVEFKKVIRDAIVNDIPFPEKLISNAIEDTLQKLGYKGRDSKGYLLYKGVVLEALDTKPLDLYFLVERKSRKDKEVSTVTLILSHEFDNFITDAADPLIMKNAKSFLDGLRKIVAVYELEEQISAQSDVVRKNDRKMASLIDDAADLEKKKKKLEDQIANNKQDQENLKSEINVQQQVLQTLKAKRKQ